MPTAAASPTASAPRLRRAAVASLVVGFGMLGGKWAAYLLTGSHAILSDALESIVHVFATTIALGSLLLSARPPDERYPYGYGKVGYFSAGFEGGLIALAAIAILYEAVQGLIHPQPLRQLGLGLGLVALAGAVNLGLGWWLVRQGRRHDSLILEADGHHVLSDSFTSLGVLGGVLLVWLTGWTVLDPVLAIAVAISILGTGYHLMREAATGLLDRADPALLERIVAALQGARRPGWNDVHNLRAWQAGDRTFVDFHLVVPPSWTVVQIHEANDQCLDALRRALGPATEAIIHFDPDLPGESAHPRGNPWTLAGATRVLGAGADGATAPPAPRQPAPDRA